MTLDHRAADFMREFSGKKLCRNKLRGIYARYKIKRKKIKTTKVTNKHQRKRITI